MAVGVINRLPEGVGADAYEAVAAELDVAGNPPAGMILHCAGELDGRFQIFDIWETEEQWNSFRDERLRAAQEKVMGAEALAETPDAESVITQIHNYVVG